MLSFKSEQSTPVKCSEEEPFLINHQSTYSMQKPSFHSDLKFFTDSGVDQYSLYQDNNAQFYVDDHKTDSKNCVQCLFPGKQFSEEWEQLADSFIFPLERQRMAWALFLLLSMLLSLSFMDLFFTKMLTIHIMCNLVFAVCFFTMFLFIISPYCKHRHFLFIRIMTYLSCLTYSSLLIPYQFPFGNEMVKFSPGERLWELYFVIIIVYVLIPVPYILGLFVGALLPIGYTVAMLFQMDAFIPTPDKFSVSFYSFSPSSNHRTSMVQVDTFADRR